MPDWDYIFSERGKVFTEPHTDMEKIGDLFKENQVQKILDIGCGTGRHLIFLSKMGFEMYGFDASPNGISIAKQWLKEENLRAEIKYHKMEETFPYPSNTFDAIISINVIHHNRMKDILRTVGEIERILKKGGLIFITFPKLGETWKNNGYLQEVEKGTYLPQRGKEKGLLHHFFTLEEIQDVFKSFDLTEVYDDGKNHRAILGIKR